jgi:hypothetical protein
MRFIGPSTGPSIASHAAIIFSLIAVSVLVPGWKMGLAGLDRDDAAMGYCALEIIRGGETPLPHVSLGRKIPLAYLPYHGPWDIYAILPFVATIPDRMLAMRSYILAWTLATTASVYILVFVLTEDALFAALCGFAMATGPLVSFVKKGFIYSGITTAALCCACLSLLIVALKRRSAAAWYLSCAAAGLGVGFAPQGLAVLAGWSFSVAWVRRDLSELLGRHRRALPFSAACLIFGSIPLLLANILSPSYSLDFIVSHLKTGDGGLDNAAYFHNLSERWRQFKVLYDFSTYWMTLLASCLVLQTFMFFRAKSSATMEGKLSYLPGVFFLSIMALSPFTLGSLGLRHIMMLLPLGIAAIAATSGLFLSDIPRQVLRIGLVGGLAVNMVHLRSYWTRLEADGMIEGNPRVEQAARWLEREQVKEIWLMSPWLNTFPFLYLAEKRMNYRQFRRYYDTPETMFPDTIKNLEWTVRSEGDGVFLFEISPGMREASMAVLSLLSRREGKSVRIEKEFFDPGRRSGVAIYRLASSRRSDIRK